MGKAKNPNVLGFKLKWLKTNKTLKGDSPRKKRRSITPEGMVNVLWNPCKLLLTRNLKLVLKLEGDFNDLEIQLGHANRQASESSKQVKNVQSLLKDAQVKADEGDRKVEDMQEQMAVTERRSNLLTGEIEELRNAVEQAERGRKLAETELNESNERSNLLHTQNTALINQKRKLETELQQAQG